MPEILAQTGPMLYPLLTFSLLAVMLIIERFMFFLRLPKTENDPSLKIFEKELQDNANQTKVVRDELLSFRLSDLQNKYENGIQMLRLVAVLSPMLGLLGTVLGMIKAFQDITAQNGPVLPSVVADGLGSAMLTTAYGLMIALPCLVAAFIYARLSEKRIGTFQRRLNAQSLKIEGAKFS